MAIVVNKPIPEFESMATGGLKVSNTSHLGHVVILYFYPKDNTPGCTTEAMQFRDKYKDFVKAGATVFGVSRDNMKSHDDFKEKLELPFELVADTEEKMCHMFGVVKNKIMYGKKVKGIERSTFLIGADGTLKEEWRGLKVPGHVDDVLKAVKALNKAATAEA
jgi:peroxiredoxin Q/BCP